MSSKTIFINLVRCPGRNEHGVAQHLHERVTFHPALVQQPLAQRGRQEAQLVMDGVVTWWGVARRFNVALRVHMVFSFIEKIFIKKKQFKTSKNNAKTKILCICTSERKRRIVSESSGLKMLQRAPILSGRFLARFMSFSSRPSCFSCSNTADKWNCYTCKYKLRISLQKIFNCIGCCLKEFGYQICSLFSI